MIPLVSVDIGTSSVKGLLLDGPRVRAEAARPYALTEPRPGWAEQDADAVFDGTVQVVASLLAEGGAAPVALTFSGPMHSLMAVDARGRPLTPLVTWADARAADVARRLRDSDAAPAFHRHSGTPLHAMLPALKLVWFREHDPEVWRRARIWCGIKEYVVHRLTGRWVVDASLAAATGLYDRVAGTWDREALAWVGLRPSRLPEIVPTTAVVASLPAGALPRQRGALDLVIGSSDGVLANLGVGAIEPGVWAVSLGTSGAVRACVAQPVSDPEGRLFCHPLADGLYVLGGPVNDGGIVYRWLRDLLLGGEIAAARERGIDPYEWLDPLLDDAPPGAEGLFFLPFLTGERAPLWDEDVCGALFGLGLRHGRAHILRAALEGVCYQLRWIGDLLAEQVGPPREIRATGGFTRSPAWLRILADVLGVGVRVPAAQGSAYGAAFLAWRALGAIARIEEAAALVPPAAETPCSPGGRAVYERGYAFFRRLVAAEVPWMHELRRLQAP